MHAMTIPDDGEGDRTCRRGNQQHSGGRDVRPRRAGVQRTRRKRECGQRARARRAADRRAQSGSGAAVRRRAAARCDRLRGARRGRQEAIRRHRAAAPHARDHRPGRDRRAGRGHRAQARHEGRRIRPGNHGRCRVAAAVGRAQGAVDRRSAEAGGFRHAARTAAGGHARTDRCASGWR